jgi:branched-chain amino acid transport system permease protein
LLDAQILSQRSSKESRIFRTRPLAVDDPAFTLCALFGGLGGGLFAGGFTYISPDQFGFAESVVFLTMALLGGVRSPLGAALGTALLILLPEWLRFLKVTYLAVYGGAVILLMVFMPEGIWGFLETLRQRLWPPAVLPVGRVVPLPLTAQVAREDGSGYRSPP